MGFLSPTHTACAAGMPLLVTVSPLYTAQALSSPVYAPTNVWDCQCLPTVRCPGLVQSCPHSFKCMGLSVYAAQAFSSPVQTPATPVWDCQCLPTVHCTGLVQSCPHSYNTCMGLPVSPHCTLPRPCPVLSTLLQMYGTVTVSPLYTAQALSTLLQHLYGTVGVSPLYLVQSCPHSFNTLYGTPAAHPTSYIWGKYNTILLAGKKRERMTLHQTERKDRSGLLLYLVL